MKVTIKKECPKYGSKNILPARDKIGEFAGGYELIVLRFDLERCQCKDCGEVFEYKK